MCGGREGGVAGRAPPASAEGTAVCLRRAGAVLGPPARLHPGLPLRLPDGRPQLRDLPLPPAAQEVQAHLLRQELPVWIPVRISGGDALLGMVCDLVTRLWCLCLSAVLCLRANGCGPSQNVGAGCVRWIGRRASLGSPR